MVTVDGIAEECIDEHYRFMYGISKGAQTGLTSVLEDTSVRGPEISRYNR